MERDVSVYDITEHADFVFSAGDVVVRVAKNENENEDAEQGAERPTPCVGQVGVSLLTPCHRKYSQSEDITCKKFRTISFFF